jgi:hypothetical protein
MLTVCLLMGSWPTSAPCEVHTSTRPNELKFLAIGCGPYSPAEQERLEEYVGLENSRAQGEFLVHLGDIMHGGHPAPTSYYAEIARILRGTDMPTFIVPGDNEWNDLPEPDRGWQNWTQFFMHYYRHWDPGGKLKTMYPLSDGVQHQAERPENFAFVRNGVLLVGINLPGGRVHDADEWALRLPQDARWVEHNFQRYDDQVRAAVILAQAAPQDPFTESFRAASKAFGKPVLYLHADGHNWEVDRPWQEKNILKVQTDQLGIAPPLLVTVTHDAADPFHFDRQFMRGPYLALGTPNSMCIVWRTSGDTDPVVRYGRLPNQLNCTIPRQNILVKTTDHTDKSLALHSAPAGVRQYEATINCLKSSTTYYYAVYDGDQLLAGGDPTYHFTTHPMPGAQVPLRFWVVGDSGTGSQQQADVHDAMRAFTGKRQHPLDIYLHVGDMAYDSGTDHEFERNFFKPYRLTLRNTACWPAMGNHEGATSNGKTGIGPYYDCYVLPTRGEAGGLSSGTEAYYSFDYGNVHFIALNSHDLDRSPTAPMAQWLKADLEQTDADWIFAHWHHPPYTKGSYDSDTEGQLVEMRKYIMPILEDGGVDVTFTGHSHIYERSMLIDGAYATPTTAEGVVLDDGDGDPHGDGAYRKSGGLPSHQGTVAIVTGHGGGRLSGRMGTMPIMRKVVFPEHGSVIVDVLGDTATAIMLNSTGKQLDSFQIVKRGSVTPTRVADPFQLPSYPNE